MTGLVSGHRPDDTPPTHPAVEALLKAAREVDGEATVLMDCLPRLRPERRGEVLSAALRAQGRARGLELASAIVQQILTAGTEQP
jgi:hypothetical protein